MQNIRFWHFRPNKSSSYGPAITFAWRYNNEFKQVEFSAAICSDKDQFNKKMGCSIAAGRLAKGHFDCFYLVSDNPKYSYPKNTAIIKKLENKVKNYFLSGGEEDSIFWSKILGRKFPKSLERKILRRLILDRL